MKSSSTPELNRLAVFGIEIIHHRSDAVEAPPDQTANLTMLQYQEQDNQEALNNLTEAISEVNKIVLITRIEEDKESNLEEIFTAEQIIEMRDRVHGYLGKDINSHLKELKTPPGYPLYIGRLATHFISTDIGIVTNFNSFVDMHTDPSENAIGPRERNSRELANWANEALLKQFDSFYQTELTFKLVGPTKRVEGGRISWERGIAESQFMVLDYVRDLLSNNVSSRGVKSEASSMTISDIRENILSLLANKNRLVSELNTVNPLIAEQIANAVDGLRLYTTEVFHRGRMGKPRFEKEPENARRALLRIESILMTAASLAESRDDQAEIPILDL